MENGIFPERFDNVSRPRIAERKKIKEVTWEEVYEQVPAWTKNRLRFHLKGFKLIDISNDPARTIAWGLYRAALIGSGNEDLIYKYDLDQVMQDIKLVRQLSEYMKKKGQQVEQRWRYLVDLQRLNDFLEPKDVEEFAEDIRDWVQRKPIHTWNGDEEEWYMRFEKAVDTILFRSGNKPDKQMTVDEFIQNGDVWCTSGSGYEPETDKLVIYDRVRKEKEAVKKNKWSVRWAMSNYHVKRLLFKRRKQMCKAVPKSEPAKVRAVISSDLALYLKMTYVSTFLDQILKGRQDSTLWMSADDRIKLWESMKFDGTWRMPLDQSEFDKNVTQRQVMIVLRSIKKLIQTYGADDTMLEIMDLIMYALDGGVAYVGTKKFEIYNGVLSGWRWTALIDTIVNLVEVEMAKDWVEQNSSIDAGIITINAQGDDDLFKLKTKQGAVAIWLAYESFGLGVNPGKFFLDRHRDEYLRRVMDNGIITGYPARSVASILFRNPTAEREITGQERIRTTFSKWKLFSERFDRDLNIGWFKHKMLQDAVQGTRGVTKEIVDDFINLGAIYGGIGLDNKGYFEARIPPVTIMESNPIDILGEGYTEWVDFAARYGVDDRDCLAFATQTLDLTGKQGWPKWVKYVYTFDPINTSKPQGQAQGLPGTVCIGKRTLHYARTNRLPWFPNLTSLQHMTHFEDEAFTLSKFFSKPLYDITIPRIKPRLPRLDTVPGISRTLAQLSSKPELVWAGFNENLFKHIPKRWTKDYLAGRLKAPMSPRTGWGADVVGHFSQRYLKIAESIFLSTNRPTMHLWDSLLAKIDAAVQLELKTLQVRIVE